MSEDFTQDIDLVTLYRRTRKLPHPADAIVRRVTGATGCSPSSARQWLLGNGVPGQEKLLLLEKEFGRPWQLLFPDIAKRKEARDDGN